MLTTEQQHIVEHDKGPGVVFAVPGAGKTTSLVHRIVRLTRERDVPPQRILISTFSRAGANDIAEATKKLSNDLASIHVRTSHALSLLMIRDAAKQNLRPSVELPPNLEYAAEKLLTATLAACRKHGRTYEELPRFDRKHFTEYLAICKANLIFADFSAHHLPLPSIATQAIAPDATLEWYPELYLAYEQERERQAVLTFDDFAPEAWILVEKHEGFRRRWQHRFDYIMIDEYQDMSLSQVALFDHLSASHRNVLVVGDDDQAIYDWRGASKHFLLDFAARTSGRTYTISQSFRLHAEHAALANHVISANSQRYPKSIDPAKGFGGSVTLSHHSTDAEMATAITANVRGAISNGESLREIGILVRRYAETGVIENAFLEAPIPYEVIGNEPYFERQAAALLLDALDVAALEVCLADRQRPPDELARTFASSWKSIVRTITKYISNDTCDAIQREVLGHGIQPSIACLMHSDSLKQAQKASLTTLAYAIAGLSASLTNEADAHGALSRFITETSFPEAIRGNAASEDLSDERLQDVESLVAFAARSGTLAGFRAKMQTLRQSRPLDSASPRIAIMTAFRAKGLEWNHIIVPAVNEKHYPARAPTEEERRIFYVAITRSRKTLELHEVLSRRPSPFMSGVHACLVEAQTAGIALQRKPESWTVDDALAVTKALARIKPYLPTTTATDAGGRREMATWLLSAAEALRRVGANTLDPVQCRSLNEFGTADPNRMREWLAEDVRALAPTPKPPSVPLAAPSPPLRPYRESDRVRHASLGDGVVVGHGFRSSRDLIEVAFVSGRTTAFRIRDARQHLAFIDPPP